MSYAYLFAALLYFPVWAIIFFLRKDLRKEIVTMGILVSAAGLLLEAFVWTKDWWQPKTITGTLVGIEDVIFGFLAGGIIVSIYEAIFRKRLVNIRGKSSEHFKHFMIVMVTSIVVGVVAFFYLNIHSFYASLWAMLIPTFIIYFYRRDLIVLSLASGVLITVISLPIYWAMFMYEPAGLNWWIRENISNILISGIPIEDLVWFLATGMFVAPLYELWKGKKLKEITPST